MPGFLLQQIPQIGIIIIVLLRNLLQRASLIGVMNLLNNLHTDFILILDIFRIAHVPSHHRQVQVHQANIFMQHRVKARKPFRKIQAHHAFYDQVKHFISLVPEHQEMFMLNGFITTVKQEL